MCTFDVFRPAMIWSFKTKKHLTTSSYQQELKTKFCLSKQPQVSDWNLMLIATVRLRLVVTSSMLGRDAIASLSRCNHFSRPRDQTPLQRNYEAGGSPSFRYNVMESPKICKAYKRKYHSLQSPTQSGIPSVASDMTDFSLLQDRQFRNPTAQVPPRFWLIDI